MIKFSELKEIIRSIKLRKEEKLWYATIFACCFLVFGLHVQNHTIKQLRAEVDSCKFIDGYKE